MRPKTFYGEYMKSHNIYPEKLGNNPENKQCFETVDFYNQLRPTVNHQPPRKTHIFKQSNIQTEQDNMPKKNTKPKTKKEKPLNLMQCKQFISKSNSKEKNKEVRNNSILNQTK